MKRYRLGIILFAFIFLIAEFIVTDYDDLSWSNNAGSYLGIFAMICVIISMLLFNPQEKKEEE